MQRMLPSLTLSCANVYEVPGWRLAYSSDRLADPVSRVRLPSGRDRCLIPFGSVLVGAGNLDKYVRAFATAAAVDDAPLRAFVVSDVPDPAAAPSDSPEAALEEQAETAMATAITVTTALRDLSRTRVSPCHRRNWAANVPAN